MSCFLHTASPAFTLGNNNDGNDHDQVAYSLEKPTFPYFLPCALSPFRSTVTTLRRPPPYCAPHCSALVFQSSHRTPSPLAQSKCHPLTPYVCQSYDSKCGCGLMLHFRSEESLSLSETVSCPRSPRDLVLNPESRCLWQNFAVVFFRPRRVSQRICEYPHPAPLPFAHRLRSNPVSPHLVPR